MNKDQVTGTTLLRDALKGRKQSTAVIARDLAIPSAHMHAFLDGSRTLPPDTLRALATYLFNGAVEYVPALDKLRAASTASTMTMQAYPERWDAAKHQPAKHPQRGPQPVKPVPPQPKAKRAGWVE